MTSRQNRNLTIFVFIVLLGLVVGVYYAVQMSGFAFRPLYTSYYFRDSNVMQFLDYPTDKLIEIIEEDSARKNEFGKNVGQANLNGAISVIATRDDVNSVEMLTKIMRDFDRQYRQTAAYFASRSFNRAAVPILCEVLKRREKEFYVIKGHTYNARDTEDGIISALINIDDPSALECFIEIAPDLPRHRPGSLSPSDKIGDKVDRAIARWQDIKSGKIKQTAPFDVDETRDIWDSRKTLEVSSFGGYKFTIDSMWGRVSEKRIDDTTDYFKFDRYYGGFSQSYVVLEIRVRKLDDAQVVALAKTIVRQSATLPGLPTINGNIYTASASRPGEGTYFAYVVMKVGDLEVSAELSSQKHGWLAYDLIEVIKIFKSFSRGLGPNKKFSMFY